VRAVGVNGVWAPSGTAVKFEVAGATQSACPFLSARIEFGQRGRENHGEVRRSTKGVASLETVVFLRAGVCFFVVCWVRGFGTRRAEGRTPVLVGCADRSSTRPRERVSRLGSGDFILVRARTPPQWGDSVCENACSPGVDCVGCRRGGDGGVEWSADPLG